MCFGYLSRHILTPFNYTKMIRWGLMKNPQCTHKLTNINTCHILHISNHIPDIQIYIQYRPISSNTSLFLLDCPPPFLVQTPGRWRTRQTSQWRRTAERSPRCRARRCWGSWCRVQLELSWHSIATLRPARMGLMAGEFPGGILRKFIEWFLGKKWG